MNGSHAFEPDAQDAAHKDWGDEPFGRGWNNWNIGVKSWEVKEQIIQPTALRTAITRAAKA